MRSSQTLGAKQIKLRRMEKGLNVYDGGLGENPFPTPAPIVQALVDHASETSYLTAEGIPELRRRFPSHRLVLGNGLKPLLATIQLAFMRLHPSGAIVHISPAWVSYKEQTDILQLSTVVVQTKATNMWRLTAEDLEETFQSHGLKDRPHLVIYNSPQNPTGYVYNATETAAFANVFNRYQSTVLYDNIYEHIAFSPSGDIRDHCERVVWASSLSKNYAAGGYRLGWLAFPDGFLEALRDACLALSTYLYTCPTTPVQYAAAKALDLTDPVIARHLRFQRSTYNHISTIILSAFRVMRLTCTQTQGAYYTLVNFEHYADALQNIGIRTSDELCCALAEQEGLITVSASAFGVDTPYVLRYSMVDLVDIDAESESFNFTPVREFLRVLKEWLNRITTADHGI